MIIKVIKIDPMQVERVFGQRYSCMDDIIATISKYYSRPYELMYIQSWNFNLRNNDEKCILGEKIEISNFNRFQLLKKYHNISLEKHNFNDINELIFIIENELARNAPIAIHFDAFYCPWDNCQNVMHNQHMCLVVGIDLVNNTLLITDPYYLVKERVVSIDLISKASKFYYLIDVKDCAVQDYNYYELLNDLVLNLKVKNEHKSIFSQIRQFADDILMYFDSRSNLIISEDIYNNKTFEHISNVIFGRGLFYTTLKYISRKENLMELFNLTDNFKIMISNWNTINSLFTKAFFEKNLRKYSDRLYKKIIEEADYEENTANCILEIINRGNIDELFTNEHYNSQDYNNQDLDTIFLELEPYYNNKGFGSQTCASSANLTGMCEFLVDENILSACIMGKSNIKFRFPIVNSMEKAYDNISCSSQFIQLSPINCKKISFLGCSEYGSYYNIVNITYTDGFNENIKIGFSDLAFEPIYNEHIFWKGRTACYSNDDKLEILQNNAKIYAISIPLQHNGLIHGIRLPDCGNIHIFAISLIL